MSWLGNVLKDVGRVALPVLGTALGGPLGGAIGVAIAGGGGGGGGGAALPGGARNPGSGISRGGAQGSSITSLPYLSGDESAAGNPSAAAAGPGGLRCQAAEGLNPNPQTKAGKHRAWRQTKNGGCTWHKKPSVNAMNPHAARRAIHRIKKARHLLASIERALPKSKRHLREAPHGRRS